MYTGLLHTHNLLRYAIVILLLLAIFKSLKGWFGNGTYQESDNKVSLFLFISAHLQLVIGLALYFIGDKYKLISELGMGEVMKSEELRFWAVEHITAMIIGIAIITLGRIMTKKSDDDKVKFRRQSIYFILAALLIFSAIPWPWSAVARAWF